MPRRRRGDGDRALLHSFGAAAPARSEARRRVRPVYALVAWPTRSSTAGCRGWASSAQQLLDGLEADTARHRVGLLRQPRRARVRGVARATRDRRGLTDRSSRRCGATSIWPVRALRAAVRLRVGRGCGADVPRGVPRRGPGSPSPVPSCPAGGGAGARCGLPEDQLPPRPRRGHAQLGRTCPRRHPVAFTTPQAAILDGINRDLDVARAAVPELPRQPAAVSAAHGLALTARCRRGRDRD